MSYEVRSRDLSGISSSGMYAQESYRDYKKYITNPGSTMHGYLLIKLKQVKNGFAVKFRFHTRGIWYWKPDFRIRWKWDGIMINWLCLFIHIEPLYTEVPDKIVGDHLGESEGVSLVGKSIQQTRYNFKTKIVD